MDDIARRYRDLDSSFLSFGRLKILFYGRTFCDNGGVVDSYAEIATCAKLNSTKGDSRKIWIYICENFVSKLTHF